MAFGPTTSIIEKIIRKTTNIKIYPPKPEFKDPVTNFTTSLINNAIRNRVEPVPGSIVYCDLGYGIAEHTGVYVGRNRIVHLDGSGLIEKVSPDQFLSRLGGMNSAISIYVSCKNGSAVGSKSAAAYARKMVGKKVSYNVLTNNCHRFTSECLSGSNADYLCYFYLLKDQVENDLQCNEWRAWKL